MSEDFDYTVPWEEVDKVEQERFSKKVSEIEWKALQGIAKKYKIHVNKIKDVVYFCF